MSSPDEFYIGWEDKAPEGFRALVRRTVAGFLMLVLALGAILPLAQRTIGVSTFEWGKIKSISGTLQLLPYPHLLVPRPGRTGSAPVLSTYYLVAMWKFGLNREALAPLDGKPVTLKGTLIFRGDQTMIETRPEWIQLAGEGVGEARRPEPVPLGKQTLAGEIVDSKCFLGVMNPGQLTPHRACAIRCISGGIPPVLLVRQAGKPPLYFLLVANDGRPVNKEVLDKVAEPVEITGEVERQGELLILRADPVGYRRL